MLALGVGDEGVINARSLKHTPDILPEISNTPFFFSRIQSEKQEIVRGYTHTHTLTNIYIKYLMLKFHFQKGAYIRRFSLRCV